MHAMTIWVDRGVSGGLDGKVSGATVQDIAGVTWVVWVTHPLTLLLGYCMIEGALRFCGSAFGEDSLGCFPLFLLDRVLFQPFRPRNPASSMSSESAISSARSLAGAVRERVWAARTGETEDELCFRTEGSDELLGISACRRKQDWIPPRVVRYEDTYYRLEESFSNKGPRPFGYRLRRLSAGVPGRSVLIYSPAGARIRNENDRAVRGASVS